MFNDSIPIIAVEPNGCNVRFPSLRACCRHYGIRSRAVLLDREAWGDSWHGIHFDFPADVDDDVLEELRRSMEHRRTGRRKMKDEEAEEDVQEMQEPY